MNYHNITHDDMLNGDGLRVVLWVAGCNHCCEECQNPITWAVKGGIPFDMDAFKELCSYLEKDYIQGITFSGGDPLHPENRDEIYLIANYIKKRFPTKDIWIYTGYLWEEVNELPAVMIADVLVDGPYIKDLRDTSLHWVGSSNQRIIDVKESYKHSKVVLKKD